MRIKKKIDELYRERLDHVETTPPIDSWENISAHLPEKKEKRLLPLWYTLSGIAAAIALLFFGLSDVNLGTTTSTQVSLETLPQNSFFEINPTSPAFQENMTSSSAILEAAALETRLEILKEELGVNRRQTENNLWKEPPAAGNIRETKVAESTAKNSGKNSASTQAPTINSPSTIAGMEQPQQGRERPSAEKEGLTEVYTEIQKSKAKEPLNDALARNSESGKNLSEEKLAGEAKEKAVLTRRFSIAPTAAAVYLDNFGNGNILDDQFSNREGGGEISMSYGVNLAYQLSEKIKLRSGISKVNLAYTTRAVDYASALNSQAIDSRPQNTGNFPNFPGNSFSAPGSLDQDLGFFEIPMEIEYTVLNKKTGINLIGGVSALFLKNNVVAINSEAFSADLGQANNIKDLSFSANVGVGLNYKITPLFQFNLEPILKYQINTFSNTSNVHAYYIGVYSGFSFKF